MKTGVTVGVVIAILALVVCLVPLKEVAYTVTVDYQDTETYYVDEPYEDTETYYEEEPYQDVETYYDTEPLTFEVVKSFIDTDSYSERRRIVIGGVVIQDEVVKVKFPIGCVELQNTDTISGTFRVNFSFYAVDKFTFESLNLSGDEEGLKFFGEEYSGIDSLTLEPSAKGTATYSISDIDMDNNDEWIWEYEVTPGTKRIAKEREVTKYREVEKQRTVTKYKQVEKQRIVTKQREELRNKKVTLLDYLLHY